MEIIVIVIVTLMAVAAILLGLAHFFPNTLKQFSLEYLKADLEALDAKIKGLDASHPSIVAAKDSINQAKAHIAAFEAQVVPAVVGEAVAGASILGEVKTEVAPEVAKVEAEVKTVENEIPKV